VRDATSGVLRGESAAAIPAARFDVNLLAGYGVPESVLAEARAAGEAAGFAAGWAQGQRAAQSETQRLREAVVAQAQAEADARADATVRAVQALASAADRLERQTVIVATGIEATLLDTAIDIAEAILARELSTAVDPGRDALTRALGLAPTGGGVTVRLNPADHALLTETTGAQQDVDGRAVTLVADPALAPGDALAESGATSIDARIGTALERVREVLA
jgi:flagellar assembly protein FliH